MKVDGGTIIIFLEQHKFSKFILKFLSLLSFIRYNVNINNSIHEKAISLKENIQNIIISFKRIVLSLWNFPWNSSHSINLIICVNTKNSATFFFRDTLFFLQTFLFLLLSINLYPLIIFMFRFRFIFIHRFFFYIM